MSTLPINVNQRESLSSAWLLAIITAGLILAPLILAVRGDVVWDLGPVTGLLATALFCWLYGSLIGWTHKLFRLGQFSGSLIELKPHGFQDNWSNPSRHIDWEDVQFSEWRPVVGSRVFRIAMKRRSWLANAKSFFGLNEIEFPEQYLSVPAHEIAQFMLDHVPVKILR
jgi:hypothetical protein